MTTYKIYKSAVDEVISGAVKCHDCGALFYIRNGVLDLLSGVDSTFLDEIKHWDAMALGEKQHPASHSII